MQNPFRLSDLADSLVVTQRTLIRRFHAALGEPPLSHLQKLRIDTARAMLETSTLSVDPS